MSNSEYSWHLMRTLSERILSANSATEELERWCRERGISNGHLVAMCARDAKAEFLDSESLEALHAYPQAKSEFRRVQLMTEDIVLVDALNWYFPAHLTSEMCALLRDTSVPFGRAVKALHPTRRTFFVRQSTPKEIADTEDTSGIAFEHHAIVLRGDGVPVAVVHERFRTALIKSDSFPAASFGHVKVSQQAPKY